MSLESTRQGEVREVTLDERLRKLYLIAVLYDMRRGGIAGHMMVEYECLRCETQHGYHNTNHPNICPVCAKEVMEESKK